MTPKKSILLLLLVFIPSLLIRLHPVESESFHWDSVVSQLAAQKGIVANAWDDSDTFELRRKHPPLLSYVIRLNNAVVGDDAFEARLYSIFAGSLACLVVSLTVAGILGKHRWGMAGAILGGWFVCLLPVHLYVSRTAGWDALYGLLVVSTLYFLSDYLRDPRRRALVMSASMASLAFLTSELALVLLPCFLFVLYGDVRRLGFESVRRNWVWSAVVAFMILLFLWPAGVLKLDLVRTLLFRIQDSASGERNQPWTMFYVTLFRESPGFTIVAAAGFLAYLFLLNARGSLRRGQNPSNHPAVLTLSPFFLYVTTAAALSTQQRLVYLHHIADVFPPLMILGMSSIVLCQEKVPRLLRGTLVASLLGLLLFAGKSAASPDPQVVGPQEHPGFLGIRDYLRANPAQRIYFYYAQVMEYYWPEGAVDGTRPRRWTQDKIRHVKEEDYDLVVSDWSMFGEIVPDLEALSEALRPEYRLECEVLHRRTGEPVAWIFARAD